MQHRFRKLAAGTVVLTGILILLGVFTAAEGAGLTCGQRWPLCDGPLGGLLPANYLSGVEWFHRVFAAVTGLVILGTTVAAWLWDQARRVRYAMTLALAILPVQVALGRFTVTTYEWLVLVAHFTAAAAIFALLVLATAWAYRGEMSETAVRARYASLTASLFAVPTALLSPRLIFDFGSAVQVVYYALALTVFAALLAATAWLRAERSQAATGLAAILVSALLVVGRQNYDEIVAYASVAALALVALFAAIAARWAKAEIAVKRSTNLFSDSN